jgi:ABC-2 type transport system ATP-binding protein
MRPDASATFRAEDVTKIYRGGVRANDGLTLTVEPGEVYGLLGPNGAGKSTLVKQIIGLLKPTSGRLLLGDVDLVAYPDAARQLCSYLPQAQMPINGLRARQAIELSARIRGAKGAELRRRADKVIDALDIAEWRDTLGVKLSGGIRRLVGFAMATVWPGSMVILDEPTNDVDPARRRLLWQQVRELGQQGVAVLLVTHNVLEAERSVDRLAIIDGGKLVAEGTPSSLKADDRDHLRLQLMLRPGDATPALPEWVHHHTRVGNTVMLTVAESDASVAIGWAQARVGDGVAEEYALAATTLEDVYVRLTAAANNGEARPEPVGAPA